MKSVVPFSALYIPPRQPQPAPIEKTVLLGWTVEPDPLYPDTDPATNFTPSTGEYTIPTDGHYLVVVEVITLQSAPIAFSGRRRTRVDYTIRLSMPFDSESGPDAIQGSYLDIGSRNFGQLLHLKANTRIACVQMQGAPGRKSLRLKVELVQRKRKRHVPQLTRKQIKSRRKEKRKAEALKLPTNPPSPSASCTSGLNETSDHSESDDDDDSDDSDDSEWETGFESDSTSDDLPHSKRGVGRLAKRFKSTTSPSCWNAE